MDLRHYEDVIAFETDVSIPPKVRQSIAGEIQKAKDKVIESTRQRNNMYKKMMNYQTPVVRQETADVQPDNSDAK